MNICLNSNFYFDIYIVRYCWLRSVDLFPHFKQIINVCFSLFQFECSASFFFLLSDLKVLISFSCLTTSHFNFLFLCWTSSLLTTVWDLQRIFIFIFRFWRRRQSVVCDICCTCVWSKKGNGNLKTIVLDWLRPTT